MIVQPRTLPRDAGARKKAIQTLALAERRPTPAQVHALPALRIAPRKNGLTIRHFALFSDPASTESRLFLSRIFSLEEIKSIEIDRGKGIGRLRYGGSGNIPQILRKLRQALTRTVGGGVSRAVDELFLEAPASFPIRVTRAGSGLSTWRVRMEEEDQLRLTHPLLRNRKDVAYRLEEELAAVQGVLEYKTSVFTSSVVVRFDPRRLDAPHLLRHLECCWPRLVNGLEGPPPSTRFFASFSLLGLAFTGEFFLPVLTPFVLAGLGVYGFSNVIGATKLLGRGKVGLPVLYTGTLTFTLLSGMPFSATLMASLMQLWPRWAYGTLTKRQRRLFAAHRQRAIWARRVGEDGAEFEVTTDRLKAGDLIGVEAGEIIPVDGVVVTGLAAVDEEALSGKAGALDKAPGDTVFAATFVKTGHITVRTRKVGVQTLAGFIGSQLPHGRVHHLPSSARAEQVANRMVAPALALAGLNLLATGEMQPSQTAIRPDYATAPRISAQLATLYDLSDALRRGILFRDPAALSRLPATDIYVLDDTPALERRKVAVGEIIAAKGAPAGLILSYAASAFPAFQNARARALMDECVKLRAPLLEITGRSRHAGVIRYRDAEGNRVEVASPPYVEAEGLKAPSSVEKAVAASPSAWAKPSDVPGKQGIPHDEEQLRPLWIIRENVVLGVVTFHRQGDLEAIGIITTLRARNAEARFVHISKRPQAEAEAIAARIGVTTVFGGLDTAGKVSVLQRLGRRTMWIGDGSDPDALPCIQASMVSISVAGAETVPRDAANIVILQPSLRGLVPLRRIGRHHRALLRSGYRTVFGANLFCVAGAFLGGFNTLAAAIISNLATGYVYASHRRLLDGLIARMEAKRVRASDSETPAESEDHDPQTGTSDDGAHEVEQHEDYTEQEFEEPAPEERPV